MLNTLCICSRLLGVGRTGNDREHQVRFQIQATRDYIVIVGEREGGYLWLCTYILFRRGNVILSHFNELEFYEDVVF